MTEAEWLACPDLWSLLEFLNGKVSERKLRLFACACCRQVWHLLTEERSRAAVEVAEQYADGQATLAERVAAEDTARDAWEDRTRATARDEAMAPTMDAALAAMRAVWDMETIDAARATARDTMRKQGWPLYLTGLNAELDAERSAAWAATGTCGIDATWLAAWDAAWDEACAAQAALLRDITCNPFRPVSLDPTWRTPTVVALAQAAYGNRILPAGTLDTDRLAVLADALEDAGCDNADILSHLRGPGPHVRGCWAVDLLLGKE
jgi:hypothetical protein